MQIQKVSLGHIGGNFNNSLVRKTDNPIQKYNEVQTISSSYPVNYYTGVTFKGSNESTFEETIDENYFQLPILKDANGNEYQAMPDKTQLASAESLYKGNNTICIAPTGVGKTAIANYIITKNLSESKKTYYTTPLKALSNDKYREFCKLYGEENVGLLTGDIKLKKDAPIVIMTTEIYRNMALSQYSDPDKNKFRDVNTVVFDEAHYINEEERGKIWEESIIFTPDNIQILPLSATVGNAKQFASWIDSITSKNTTLVEASPKDRFVPLVYYEYKPTEKNKFKEVIKGKIDVEKLDESFKKGELTDKEKRGLDLCANNKSVSVDEALRIITNAVQYNPVKSAEFSEIIRKNFALKEQEALEATQLLMDYNSKTLNSHVLDSYEISVKEDFKNFILDLEEAKKLPAIIFKFSRSACDGNVEKMQKQHLNLTTSDEKKEIEKIIEDYKSKNVYLGKNFDKESLLSGIAAHHAGLVPGYKKLVEELFSKKLLKTVFATTTLSAGINMPAKTVVITQVQRPAESGEETVPISVNEFQQMSGRAGRRGIDTIGNVILYNLSSHDKEIAKTFMLKNPDPMISKYEPSYNFLASFYKKNEDPKMLDDVSKKTFLLSQMNNKDKAIQLLNNEFRKYEDVLNKFEFLEITPNGYKTTPKGALLSKAHGYNELTLVDMLYNKKLANLNANELASFAASMVNSGIELEDEVQELVETLMYESCEENKKSDILYALDQACEFDSKVEILENGQEIQNKSQITDMFSGYLTYNWLNLQDNGMDSVRAFRQILKDPKTNGNHSKEYPGFNYYPFKQVFEGDIYGVLSQTIDVLKQIINMCEFALSDNRYEADKDYYETILYNAQEAVEKIKQPPLYDGLSVA